MNEAEIKAILLKEEVDRTPEEKKALADFFEKANRKPVDEDPKAKGLMTIEEAFNHPRFKELVQKANDSQARADALDKAAKEAETKRLQEQNNYKELYEKSQSEINSLKARADSLGNMEETMKTVLTSEIESLPEQFRGLIPEGSVQEQLKWLGKNKAVLVKPEAFDIGAGAGGSKKPQQKANELSPEEKQAARDMGMTDEDYLKHRDPVPTA